MKLSREHIELIRRSLGRERIIQNEVVRRIPADGLAEAKREAERIDELIKLFAQATEASVFVGAEA